MQSVRWQGSSQSPSQWLEVPPDKCGECGASDVGDGSDTSLHALD